jgi:GT2 family glycosyltransferase
MSKKRTSRLGRIEFDQFHRYGAAAVLLKPLLAALGRPARILEIGCNVLDHLPAFLDPFPIELVRCDVEDHRGGAGNFVRIRRDAPLPFEDQRFDFAIALEVLEHVPAEDRLFTVSEWLRVASRGVLLTCPNGVPEVRQAEARVAAAYARRHGEAHPWLREHEQFGLPTESSVTALFEKLGVSCRVLGNSPLGEWLPLLLLSEELTETTSRAVVERFNRLLNTRSTQWLTRALPYRKIYFACKEEGDAAVLATETADGAEIETDPVVAVTRSLREVFRRQGEALAAAEREATWLTAVRQALQEERSRTAQLECRLWQLDRAPRPRGWWSKLSAWLEPVLPRHRHGLERATPHQLAPLPGTPAGGWEAQGEEPCFLLDCSLPAGWIRVELSGRFPAGSAARLYYDTGDGFRPEQCLDLCPPFDSRRVYHYGRLERPARRLRFHPVNAPGFFAVERFRVEPCTALEIYTRAALTYLRDHGHPRNWLAGLRKLTQRFWSRDLSRGVLDRAGPAPARVRSAVSARSYQTWLEAQALSIAERQRIRQELAGRNAVPRFSLLLPLARVEEEPLRQTLASLARQNHEPRELLIAVAESDLPALTAVLRSCPESPQVRTVTVAAPFQASVALNQMLESAAGEFVVPLDAGDELEPDALLVLAEAAARHPDRDFFYSDEDEAHPVLGYRQPCFKPDWSPEHFSADPYTGRLAAYRTARCRQLGGFQAAHEGAHEFDLILRLTGAYPCHSSQGEEQGQARAGGVYHIPRVLYHRATPREAALRIEAADRVLTQGGHATVEYREEMTPDGRGHTLRRLRFPIPGQPRVSIVIPTAGRSARIHGRATTLLENCLASIRSRTRWSNHEIIIVDNGDLPADLAARLVSDRVKRLTFSEPFNLAAKINLGAAHATGDYLLLLNDDTEVITPDWLEALLEYACQPGVGAVGAKLFFPDGRLQHIGVLVLDGNPGHACYAAPGSSEGYFRSAVTPRNYLAVTGACLMTPRQVFTALGGFDVQFPLNYNDVDYCLRLRERGLRCVYTPHAQLYHFEAVSKEGGTSVRPWELERFQQRWRQRYPGDPHHNVNLSPLNGDYQRRA